MTTVRKSLNELTISKERLAQLEALQVADVVTSDIPELDVTFWENSKLSVPAGKKQLTIRLDADVLCLLYTSPSPRDLSTSRMPSSA